MYALIRDGVPVTHRNEKNELVKERFRVLDFERPENNHFLCVRELWVRGDLYRRRPDIIGFVNGLPLLFIECKNIHRNLEAAHCIESSTRPSRHAPTTIRPKKHARSTTSAGSTSTGSGRSSIPACRGAP